ncbi:uncharacterized protein LOC110605500 [Manihot esculenta]|uniref:Senescence regulator n=1 Tax=Manihot esculenta TaxID=3983 RepID=A0A2C9U6H5_MANES|nr:uncharacterized protein LOC110605500 [Manihot esculenta]OAY25029.1 hypothetical protein MANES_17G062700v8 [Manihot esculenta]
MAAEEFQESDIIFSDHNLTGFKEINRQNHSCSNRSGSKTKLKKSTSSSSSSVPVNIPCSNVVRFSEAGAEFDEEFDGEELIPPHVIVGRRIQGKMAFSVCTGNGRTLKGRDLSQVRNSILRLTGFLET